MLRELSSELVGSGGPRPITVGVAARRSGYSESSIRRALARGDLEGYRAGQRGRYMIPPQALADWIRPAAHDPEDTRQ